MNACIGEYRVAVACLVLAWSMVAGGCGGDDDPVTICESYTGAMCEKGKECVGSEQDKLDSLFFCELDCAKMNACEELGMTSHPDERRACIESIPDATCDPDDQGIAITAIEQTAECEQWEELSEATIEASDCHEPES